MKHSVEQFHEHVLKLVPQLRAYAVSLCGARDTADDLVQDTLVKAWENQDKLREFSKLKGWLITILRNEFRAQCRRAKFVVDDHDGHYAGLLVAEPEQDVQIEILELAEVLAEMPKEQREVLVLVYVNELSYEEAAAAIGCPIGTLKSRVNRARSHLVAQMNQNDDDAASGDYWAALTSGELKAAVAYHANSVLAAC